MGPSCDVQRRSIDVGGQTHDTELAVAELGERAQAAPSRMHHRTTKNCSLTIRMPITTCQQDWHTDLTSRSPAQNAAAQSEGTGRPHTLETYPTILAPRATSPRRVPLHDEESSVTIDSSATAWGFSKMGSENWSRNRIYPCVPLRVT